MTKKTKKKTKPKTRTKKKTENRHKKKRKTQEREETPVHRHFPADDVDIDESEETELQWKGQRLYVLGFDRYVQYDGVSKLPKILKEYVDAHRGEFPAYMPLPEGPVTFRLGAEFGTGRRVRWNGKENLPDPVLRYVRENGTLPRYSEEIEF